MHGVRLSPTPTAKHLPQLNAFHPVAADAANLLPAPPVTLSAGCIVVVHLIVNGQDRNLLLLVDRAHHPPKPKAAKTATRRARTALVPQVHVDDVSYKYNLLGLQGYLLPHALSPLVTNGSIPADWSLVRQWDPFELSERNLRVTGATLYGRTLPGREWQALLQPPPNSIAPLFGIRPPPALEGGYVPRQTQRSREVLIAALKRLREYLALGHVPDVPEVLEKELLAAYHSEDQHFPAVLLSLLLAYHTNRTDLAINGIFGAGKTRTMALLLAFLALQPGTQVVVVAKENVATRALSQYLQEFLQQTIMAEAVKLVGRYCSAEEYQRVGTGRTPFDVHPDDRRANLHQSRVVLVTAGVIKGQFGTDRSYSSLFPRAALIVHEEAQQFGALVEAIAMAAVASCALRVWSGDKLQTLPRDTNAHYTTRSKCACSAGICPL